MLIEVADIQPPSNGKKLATVRSAAGELFSIWPDKLPLLRVGGSYQVEVAEREFNGRLYRKITKAEAVNGQVHGAMTRPNRDTSQRNGGKAGAAGEAEQRFVIDLLAVGLRSGAVAFSAHDLRTAIAMLRALWHDLA